MTQPSPTPGAQSTRSRMSLAEREARAAQRAHDEHVQIFAVPGRPGVYTTKSKRDPGERYSLVAKGGIEACNCRAYFYRQSCKHVEALRNRLAREARRQASTPASPALLYA